MSVVPYYDEDGITIYHGDCREVLPSLELSDVSLVLTDPPYGVTERTDRASKGRGSEPGRHRIQGTGTHPAQEEGGVSKRHACHSAGRIRGQRSAPALFDQPGAWSQTTRRSRPMTERIRSFAARPTVYKGIRMRSRTEAAFAARLDRHGVPWEYEPECYANEVGQYLPDFRVHDRNCTIYIEVKGVLPLDQVESVQKKMEVIWASEADAMLAIIITSTGEMFHVRRLDDAEGWHYHYAGEHPAPPAAPAGARIALGAVRSAGKPPESLA